MSKLVFLGTGCSGGTPLAGCLMGIFHQAPLGGCQVCARALADPSSPDRRGNPSLLLQSPTQFNIVFDVGKTFHDAACEHFLKHNVHGVDAVVLTHEHADAILGLDDLRVCQRSSKAAGGQPAPPVIDRARQALDVVHSVVCKTSANDVEEPPHKKYLAVEHYWTQANEECLVFAAHKTIHHVASAFPYLIPGGGGGRFVSKLKFVPFQLAIDTIPASFTVENYFGKDKQGLSITPLPVEHGPGFLSAGFYFGTVVYLSDISALPELTKKFILSQKFDLLILDCLRPVHPSTAAAPVHFDLKMALECVETLGPPKKTLLTGIGHEMPHAATNEALRKLPAERFGQVELAFDGMVFDLPDLTI